MRLKLVTDDLVRQHFSQLNSIMEILADRLTSKLAHSMLVTVDESKKICRFSLMSQDGKILSSHAINFPLESMLVNAEVDQAGENLIFTLQNGNKTVVPVGSIVKGFATTEQLNAEKEARRIADTNLENKITTEALARAQKDAELSGEISQEKQAREDADQALRESIALESQQRAEAVEAFPFFIGQDGYVYGKE